jgi:hypothetical protein
MKATATTTVSLLRGTTTDAYGDTIDATTTVATGVTASLIEQRRTTKRRDEREPRTARYYVLRVPAGTDLRRGDRVRDERTSYVYIVDEFDQPVSPIRILDIRADLRRIT